ncbi:MAG: DUF1127 domain-containing protein [Loktanella sp.]|jgi:uncharacterized protein YjiS (DUF1127 family)|nr:DUF1127 domain-containing protein [Amylibacter sp.]MDO7556270.1 DUF1127 domain-containing protein [Loktanella sp.]MDO7607514.1 DUF1127 domain-containing protein [Loktanella sp.]MDO7622574.1 DUF1127 domain-containing protein [Loktanella sp.]MDO7626231.1 DUF1127 domain-containing protein [Loktanella sp.]
MSAFTTTTPAVFSAGRLTKIAANAFGVVAAWNDARITRKSLSKLSARELADIGLSFGDIETIATRSVR